MNKEDVKHMLSEKLAGNRKGRKKTRALKIQTAADPALNQLWAKQRRRAKRKFKQQMKGMGQVQQAGGTPPPPPKFRQPSAKPAAANTAAKESLKDIMKSWSKGVSKSALNPEAIGKGLAKGLGVAGIAALGAKGLDLPGAIAKKFAPKKTLTQKLLAAGSPGRKALMFGAGAAGIMAGIKGLEAGSDAIIDPIKKKRSYNKMMDDNSFLKKEKGRDVKRIFSTLYRFNPKMAGDPLVAGSFLRRALQFKEEGIQPVDIKTLTEAAKNVAQTKNKGSLLRDAFIGSGADLSSFA